MTASENVLDFERARDESRGQMTGVDGYLDAFRVNLQSQASRAVAAEREKGAELRKLHREWVEAHAEAFNLRPAIGGDQSWRPKHDPYFASLRRIEAADKALAAFPVEDE